MSKFLFLSLLCGMFAHAEIGPLLYLQTGDTRISNALENMAYGQIHFEYDVAKNGGSKAAHSLHVMLPANAVITRSYFQVNQVFTSASAAGTVALSCQNANNIKTATDISGSAVGDMVEGASTGSAANFKRVTADCVIQATVASFALVTGQLKGWVSFVVGK